MSENAELDPWPAEELESVPNCPVCGGGDRELLHQDLTDRVFRVAPGVWTLYRCRGCRSAWLDPRPSPESLGMAYASYYTHDASDHPIVRRLGLLRTLLHDALNGYMNARYGLRRKQAFWPGRWLIPLLPNLRAAADAECRHMPRPPSGGGLVLDVGCGNGRFLKLAEEMGWLAEGIDLDPVAVKTARERGFAARCGTIDVLHEVSERYDAITLSHVIEHVYDPLSLLRNLYRLLKPGGTLWLETPNLDSLGHARYGSAWRDLDPPRHLVLFNPQSLADLVRQAGFENLRRHWNGLVVYSVFAASEAIKENRDTSSASRNGRPPLGDLLAELIEAIRPEKREFITMLVRKP